MPSSLSIITSVRNCKEETKFFLESLKKYAPSSFKELILIDDGSEKETMDFSCFFKRQSKII